MAGRQLRYRVAVIRPWKPAACARLIARRPVSPRSVARLAAGDFWSDNRGMPTPSGAAQAASASTPAPRVVLADDDVLLREGLASLLDRSGFEVVGQAGDATQLLALAREVRPDLVV